MKKLTTDNYKGVRDFYPEEMWQRKWMFNNIREVVESFGFVEYDASILEPSSLYTEKSGEEIINEQTYTFVDRGGRSVTLRPEMTPTVARMISAKRRELGFPLRWYSIPNLFRYEAPQRGRLREHWQLNVDIFGQEDIHADIEVIEIGSEILRKFKAKEEDFVIKINSRLLQNMFFDLFSIPSKDKLAVMKILDKRKKIDSELFSEAIGKLIPDKSNDFIHLLDNPKQLLETLGEKEKVVSNFVEVLEGLFSRGIKNVQFDPSLTRGFDYYTGTVFEFFDTLPQNNRSLFGGGRYDELTTLFDSESVPAVGFGMGDVTLLDFLKSRNLIPTYICETSIYLAVTDKSKQEEAEQLAQKIRNQKINVAFVGYKKSRGDVVKAASKNKIPFIIIVDEKNSGTLDIIHTWKDDTRHTFNKDNISELNSFIGANL